METDLAKFQDKNVQVIALAVQDLAGAQSTASETGVTYPVLADPDHRVAEAYKVYNLLGDGVATPAVFIIDQTGQIAWSYIGQNLNDRPANQTILDHLPGN